MSGEFLIVIFTPICLSRSWMICSVSSRAWFPVVVPIVNASFTRPFARTPSDPRTQPAASSIAFAASTSPCFGYIDQFGTYCFWFVIHIVLSSTLASSLASFTTRSTICWRGSAVAIALRTLTSSRPGTVESMSKCSHCGPSADVYSAPSTDSMRFRNPIWFCG